MKSITTFLFLCAFSYHTAAQDVVIPDHNGSSVQFYPAIIYLVLDSKADSTKLSNVVSESRLTFSESTNNIAYTANGNNRWLRKMNDDPFTVTEISRLQTKLGDSMMVSPVYYTTSSEGDKQIFAPLPNVLIIDREFVTDKVVHYLNQNNNVVVNKDRTQKQVALTIFDVPFRGLTVFEIQKKLIEKFPQLNKHVRFENQMLVSQEPARSSGVQPITAQQRDLDQWNLDIIKSDPSQFTYTPAVKIGLIEMGCDVTHPSLNLVGGMMDDPRSSASQLHGTMMAGIIGAKSSSPIHGVTPNIQIVPVARTNETDVMVAEAISYCINQGVNVINMSFGRDASGRITGGPTWNFANIDGTLTYAHNHDIVLVAAAGNAFSSRGVEYPARHPAVIAVGASDKADKILASSNYGDLEYLGKTVGISVVAPGAEMYVIQPGGSIHETETGTSGATAHVTAMAALLKSLKPSLTADSIRYIIEHTADKIDVSPYGTMAGFSSGTRNTKYGYGRINVEKALDYINPVEPPKCPWLCILLIVLGVLAIIVIIVVIVRKKKK